MESNVERESWGSRLGFIFAAVGSAVGLANIWKFPYTVGKSGGAAFIILYFICLLLIGFPVFVSEVLIGRRAKSSPCGAMAQIGGKGFWRSMGTLMVLTGFIISALYSAVAGWVLGYLVEALSGRLTVFQDTSGPVLHFETLLSSPWWGLTWHFCFLAICLGVLFTGVQHGIERGNKIMMPLLLVVLLILVVKGLTLPNSFEGLKFLLSPDWSAVTPAVVLTALGQSFFTLSVGQGTMITYGSYLDDETNIPGSCFPIAMVDTLISLLSAVAVFTIVFSVGLQPDAGEGLLFHTLPLVFSQISGGYVVAILFFLLVLLAAISSEISAMEPLTAYLIDEWGWSRHQAALLCGAGAFLVGVPCALSSSVLADFTIGGMTILDCMSFVAIEILVPLGGLLAVILVGWRWGVASALKELSKGTGQLFDKQRWIYYYFHVGIKYLAPALILLVFLHEMGVI